MSLLAHCDPPSALTSQTSGRTTPLGTDHYGGVGKDTIYGGTNDDSLFGEDGDDRLFGDAQFASEYYEPLGLVPGNDTLDGGAGSDKLNGGGGDDNLTGGIGSDLFLFESPTTVTGAYGTSLTITSGNDVVTDFKYK
jgi:Ca2+-binding RTX toxin-like protein